MEPIAMFVEGDALYDAMLADIAGAQVAIRIESYIFADDEIGLQFIDALGQASRSGITTQLRLDAAGSWNGLQWSSVEKLAKDGVVLTWSRPWSWRHPFAIQRRNHRKLLIVDDQVVYLGGFNIHRSSSRRAMGVGRWRDTRVRITGPRGGGKPIAKISQKITAAKSCSVMLSGRPALAG